MNPSAADANECATRLRRQVTQLARRLRPAMQRDGLSAAKLGVIARLHRAGTMSPTELAVADGVKLPSLTRLIAELEAEGWVAREADFADRRRSLLSLTTAGRKRLVVAARAAEAPLARAIAAVANASERRILLQACELLERISEAMASHEPESK